MTDPNPNPNRIPNRKLSQLEMAENGGPFGMAAPRNGGPTPTDVTYYYDLLLSQQLLPAIYVTSEFIENSAPSYKVRYVFRH